jgi:hypothetical protein
MRYTQLTIYIYPANYNDLDKRVQEDYLGCTVRQVSPLGSIVHPPPPYYYSFHSRSTKADADIPSTLIKCTTQHKRVYQHAKRVSSPTHVVTHSHSHDNNTQQYMG